MLLDVIKIGEYVQIDIPKENREWGYNPAPDGTIVEIIGWGEIHYGHVGNFRYKPGVYLNKSWVDVKTIGPKVSDDGTIEDHIFHISACHLAPLDSFKEEYEERLIEYRKRSREDEKRENFIRDLPEVPFYEGDKIKTAREGDKILVIIGIDWHYLDRFCDDGITPFPAYRYSDTMEGGWSCAEREENIQLIERGNIWKYYHNEPMSFENIEEEAKFYDLIGRTDDVRNPACNLYVWTVTEAYQALIDGIGDAFSVGSSMFSGTERINVLKYRDEEVGDRVRAYTLQNITPDQIPDMQKLQDERRAEDERRAAEYEKTISLIK